MSNTIAHFALDFSRKESVFTHSEPDGFAPLPRGAPSASGRLGDGGAMLRRRDREECLHVYAQAWATRQGAVFIQSKGSSQRRAHQAGEFEAGAGAGPAAPAEQRHQRLLEVAGGDTLEVEDRDQHLEALRPARVGRQNRR
jgi:hypothetical protein